MTGCARRARLGLAAGLLGAVVGAGPVPGVGSAAAAEEAPPGRVVLRFQDRSITESSGLVDAGEVLYTVNDSGSGPELFTVDARTGETLRVTRYSDGEVEDVEALAPAGDGAVWVADIGDNAARRDTVWVYRVRPGSSDPAARFGFRYPGGARDAEALLAHPRTGRLFVVSKSVFGAQVYAAPRRLSPGRVHRLRPWARVAGLVTDGAFLPDGRHVLLRGYAAATLHTFPGFAAVGSFALPPQQQGEGLAVGEDGRVLLSSEGVREPVLEIDVPDGLPARTDPSARPEPGGPPTTPEPVPSTPGGTSTQPPDGLRAGGRERGLPWEWWSAGLATTVVAVALARRAGGHRGRREGA